jgi:hypothetical protein
MKILKSLVLVLSVFFVWSCEKHEIEYDTTSIADQAEFQLHYFVPVTASSSNNIYKVEINNELYANSTAPLSTYNAIPNGAVGKFYVVEPGSVNIKLYMGTDEVLVYDQNTELVTGKQNIFVYDFDAGPIVLDNEYPYEANVTEDTDSITYIKFYNFLYETEGVPCDLRLQYQYLDPYTNEPINVGDPVLFGEATGWEQVRVIKSVYNSAGYARVDYRIKVVDTNGNATEDLEIMNSSGNYVNYSDYWTGHIGRRRQHVMAGMRSSSAVRASVRQFTAL